MYQLEPDQITDGFPKPISEVFPGLPNDIDAGFYYYRTGKTYFFKVNSIIFLITSGWFFFAIRP